MSLNRSMYAYIILKNEILTYDVMDEVKEFNLFQRDILYDIFICDFSL